MSAVEEAYQAWLGGAENTIEKRLAWVSAIQWLIAEAEKSKFVADVSAKDMTLFDVDVILLSDLKELAK